MPPRLGKRITVYGPAGSGKTTLARDLGAALGLPVVELDAIFHARAGWVDLSTAEFRARVSAVLAEHADGWVIEGNYGMVRDLILSRADTVVWLRLPFRTVYRRLAWRTLTRSMRNEELWNGNRETWRQTLLTRDSMLLWGIRAWRRTPRRTREALATIPHQATVIELRTPREVAALTARARRQP